jgi:hypothetical protein
MHTHLQAKMLAEMDDEFGISELISDVATEDRQKVCEGWSVFMTP